MKRIIITITAILFFVILYFLTENFLLKKSMQKNFNHYLLPIKEHIENFREKNKKIPSIKEFRGWSDLNYENKSIDYHLEKPNFVSSWGKSGECYLIGIWLGEDYLFYCSWNGKMFYTE